MVRRTLDRLESGELTLQEAISGLRGILYSTRPTSEGLRVARVGDRGAIAPQPIAEHPRINRTQLNAVTDQTQAG